MGAKMGVDEKQVQVQVDRKHVGSRGTEQSEMILI